MTDAVLSLPLDAPHDPASHHLQLGGHPLVDVLENGSWQLLTDAVEHVGRDDADTASLPSPLVLFTRDGRTLEADIRLRLNAVAIEVHDISRHVDDAERFAKMALQLHRRNRDLQFLYDTTTALGETLDPEALVATTANVLGDYLEPAAVMVEAAGEVARWGRPWEAKDGAAPTERDLETARGSIGSVTWWRGGELTQDESQVVDVIVRKAAVSIDHALLLMPPPAADDRDEFGLLTGPAGRRALAGFVRPFAVAVVSPPDTEPETFPALAAAVLPGRSSDVKARWGKERILVALAGAGTTELEAWLARAAPAAPAAVVLVEHDIDAAIHTCVHALGRSGSPQED